LYPIHALSLSDDTYLIDKFSRGIRYAPSCTILKLSKRKQKYEFSNFLGIPNPTNDLHYSNLEVNTIASLFESSQVLTSQKATKSTLLNDSPLSSMHCIHFSCHGSFNQFSPKESKLFLADDTYLNLNEIYDLSLNHCQLTVLSACETGVTDCLTPNNEYNSLASGFIVAGSASVVSSLWSVDQISTAFLLIRFYESLKSHKEIKEGDIAIALCNAQVWLRNLTSEEGEKLLKMLKPHFDTVFLGKPRSSQALERAAIKRIKSGEHPFSDPFYWASFVAVGY
jgi:CHAT domain-containing protein